MFRANCSSTNKNEKWTALIPFLESVYLQITFLICYNN